MEADLGVNKYMIIRCLLTGAAFFLAATAHAQWPVVPGEPALTPKAVPQPLIRLPTIEAMARATLPPVTAAEIESVREANRRSAVKQQARRVRVGIVRGDAAQGGLPAAARMWTPVAGGRAAQIAVTSPEAGSLRLAIDLAGVPEDVEMVFFGSATARLEGPVRVGEVRDRSAAWWSPVTEGATQTVEFFVPARHDPAAWDLRVVRAAHLFTTPSSRFAKRLADIGTSGSCNVDIACSPLNSTSAFQDVADSVAQMVFNDGQFITLCTGSLLADGNSATQIPWFYSADHCMDNESAPYKTPAQMQQVADTLSTLWGFQANSCVNGQGSNVPEASWSQLPGGAALIYNSIQNDVLLLRLNNAPPAGSFYSGWDANPVGVGASVVSVHHPEGDLKKVSQGSIQGFFVPGVAGGVQSFIEVLWGSGTTEPGSSGGGLWTSGGGQYYFRGGLWGGSALCTNPFGTDNFSRLDQVYPQLAAYLGPAITPAADYTDLWWNPNESGWGLNLVQHSSKVVFGVWYTYELDGTRTWIVMPSGSWTSSTSYTGPLYTTNGPPFTATPFNPSLVQARQVGTATLTFSSENTGAFAYSVDGVSGTKTIQRQPF